MFGIDIDSRIWDVLTVVGFFMIALSFGLSIFLLVKGC